jgi:heme exporter protein D
VEEYAAIRDYAAFIWTAWGIAGALMLAIWGSSASMLRRRRAQLAMLETGPENTARPHHDP